TEIVQRCEHLAELHLLSFALCPPLFAVKAVAREQDRQPDGSLTPALAVGLGTPSLKRLEPGQRHRDAHAAQEYSTGKRIGLHTGSSPDKAQLIRTPRAGVRM